MAAAESPVKLEVDEATLEIGRSAAKGVLFGGVPLTELSHEDLLAAAGFLNLELKDLQQRAQAAIDIMVGEEAEAEG